MQSYLSVTQIRREQWADFILGLLTTLNVNQTELSLLLGYKGYFTHLCSWKTGGRIPSSLVQNKLISFAGNNNLCAEELIVLGNKKRNSLTINGVDLLFSEARSIESINGPLIFEQNGKQYINSYMLFPSKLNGKTVQFFEHENSIVVFFRNRYRAQPYPLVLPRKMEITEALVFGLGLYLGEGTRTCKHVPKITNSEPELIKQAIAFFDVLGISKSELSAWLQIHEFSKLAGEEVKEFWEKFTDIPISKVWIKKKTGKKIVEVKQYGTVHIELMRILARPMIDSLLNNTNAIAHSILDGPKYLLQGLFAAEGSVLFAPSGAVRSVSFTSLRLEDQELVRSLLNEFGIIAAKPVYRGSIRIHGYENIKRLMGINIFKCHPDRKGKLEQGYANFSKIPGMNKSNILKILSDGNLHYTTEIQHACNLQKGNTNKHLLELFKLGKVKSIPGSGSLQNKWFI